jgi:hypothetical protein
MGVWGTWTLNARLWRLWSVLCGGEWSTAPHHPTSPSLTNATEKHSLLTLLSILPPCFYPQISLRYMGTRVGGGGVGGGTGETLRTEVGPPDGGQMCWMQVQLLWSRDYLCLESSQIGKPFFSEDVKRSIDLAQKPIENAHRKEASHGDSKILSRVVTKTIVKWWSFKQSTVASLKS